MAANLALSLLLFFTISFVGIALATAASSWINVLLLAVGLHQQGTLRSMDVCRRLHAACSRPGRPGAFCC